MTSELKPHEIISGVVCAGPKKYAYKTVNPMSGECKTICKVRKITLNFSAYLLINCTTTKDMILSVDADETVIVRTKNKIKHKGGAGRVSIISQPEEKAYRVSF
jgi:hypothetical protein